MKFAVASGVAIASGVVKKRKQVGDMAQLLESPQLRGSRRGLLRSRLSLHAVYYAPEIPKAQGRKIVLL
jgi:hypothetical protein